MTTVQTRRASARQAAHRAKSDSDHLGALALSDGLSRDEEPLSRQANHAAIEARAGAAWSKATAGGGGEVPYRREMERAFGQDFSGVKAHVGRKAEMSAIQAKAATVGESVAFAESRPDKRLVAHELTHVVQNRRAKGGGGLRKKTSVSKPGDAAEVEADRMADAIGSAPSLTARAGDNLARKADVSVNIDPAAIGEMLYKWTKSGRGKANDHSGLTHVIQSGYRSTSVHGSKSTRRTKDLYFGHGVDPPGKENHLIRAKCGCEWQYGGKIHGIRATWMPNIKPYANIQAPMGSNVKVNVRIGNPVRVRVAKYKAGWYATELPIYYAATLSHQLNTKTDNKTLYIRSDGTSRVSAGG